MPPGRVTVSVAAALSFVVIATGVPVRVHAQGTEADATAKYASAMAEGNPAARIALLQASYEAMHTFKASIAIAETLLVQRSAPTEARMWSERAYAAADTAAERARALFRLAQTYQATSQLVEYKALLNRAVEEAPDPLAQQALVEVSRPTVMKADDIVRAWSVGGEPRVRDLVVEPSVNLAVNFEFNSAAVDASGQAQLKELANAIGLVSGGAHRRLVVVGHTDTLGSDEYNLMLSRKRAEAVRQVLVSRYRLPADDIAAEGRGMREPLVPGDSPEQNAVNRRVEVRLLP